MTAHKIEQRPVESLVPYARNARTHSDEQVAQIAASIKEFGWTNPILVDGENGIIAGHGRLQAARKLGLKQVPVIELAHLTDTQRRAYILADNKLALNAGWDYKTLAVELDDLAEQEFDVSLIGFAEGELDTIAQTSSSDGLEDLNAGGDESRSSSNPDYLKFGKNEVALTAEELESLNEALVQYLEQYGVSFGFASWLVEGKVNRDA